MAADPKCPVCGSLSFFVKDPADEYETHEFMLVDGETRDEVERPEKVAELVAPWLAPDDPGTKALSAATKDLCEFLMELKQEGKLNLDFRAAPKSVAYPLPCHLNVQRIRFKASDLLALTGAKVTTVEKCSGHDGTWAMKVEYFEESMKVGRKLFDPLLAANAEVIASDCALASVQITQGTSRPVKHPVEVLRDAYGLAPA